MRDWQNLSRIWQVSSRQCCMRQKNTQEVANMSFAMWFTQIPNLARSSLKHKQTLLQSQLIIIYKILYINKHSYIYKILLQIRRVQDNNNLIIKKGLDWQNENILRNSPIIRWYSTSAQSLWIISQSCSLSCGEWFVRARSATSVSNRSNLKPNQFETEGTQNWSGISSCSLVTSVTYFGTIRTCVIAMWASWSSCSMTSTLNSGDDKHVFGLLLNSRTLHNCILITSLSLVS